MQSHGYYRGSLLYKKKYPHVSYTINLGLMLIRASNAHMILPGNYG